MSTLLIVTTINDFARKLHDPKAFYLMLHTVMESRSIATGALLAAFAKHGPYPDFLKADATPKATFTGPMSPAVLADLPPTIAEHRELSQHIEDNLP